MFDKQWKCIAEMIKTRTVVQVRTHAQKYFAKQKKRQQNGDGVGLDGHASLSYSNSIAAYSSSHSISSQMTSDPSEVRRFKKASLKGTSRHGLSILVPGTRLHRSGSIESTSTSDYNLTPRTRKRTAAHQSDFYYEDHGSESTYTSDDADTVTTTNDILITPNKRRISPRMTDHSGGALFDPCPPGGAAGHLAVDLAFDADFRADISELNIDGMGGLDKLVFNVPIEGYRNGCDWLKVSDSHSGDDDTSVDAYSPMSHTESCSTHEDELFMCANETIYAYPAPDHDGIVPAENMFSDLFPMSYV